MGHRCHRPRDPRRAPDRSPVRRADVGISGDKIAAVGDLSGATAGRRIDLSERMVAPGFIDLLGQSELNVLVDNRVESKIRQGITTEIYTLSLHDALPISRS